MTNEMSGFTERFTQIRRLVIWVLLGGLLLGVIVGSILAVQIGKPLSQVTQAVETLTRGDHLEPLIEAGPQEIRRLEIAFNSLLDRLRSLEQARRQLLANLVHELGRPLGALRSAIQALQSGADEDQKLHDDLLKGMDDTTGRLQRLLDELAALHGQVLGSLELNRQPVQPSEWLPAFLTPYKRAAEEKQLVMEIDIPNDLPILNIDTDRIAQAVQNLVLNAIQFSPPGESVKVQAWSKEGKFYLLVLDNGPGIPSAEQELIWKPFYRGSNRGRFPQGMGLGLGIAKEAVEAHGGTIELISDGNQGAEFTITLEEAQKKTPHA